MNFLISLLSVFLTSGIVLGGRDYSSSSSYPSSSISFSSSGNSNQCRRELDGIVSQPQVAAIGYFSKFKCTVEAMSYLWFQNSTQVQTVNNFANMNGLTVRVYDAFGFFTEYPIASDDAINADQDTNFGVQRAMGLNDGVFSKGVDTSSYTFEMFSRDSKLMVVQLIAPNSQLPLNVFTFKTIR